MLSRIFHSLSAPYPLSANGELKLQSLIRAGCVALILIFPLITLFRITWDPPSNMCFDGALYTDEGFYSSDAVLWYLTGEWFKEGRYNQFINLPILQFIQAGGFAIFGMNLLVVRLINWVFMLLWIGATFLLFRRLLNTNWAILGTALLCANHVVYGMSRFALAEIPMAFMVTAAFVCALYAVGPRRYYFAALCAIFYSLAILTKTNAMFLAPLLALTTVLAEPRPKEVLLKFLLCSAIFFSFMGVYYVALVAPHRDQFEYFYTLNIAIAGSTDLSQWKDRFEYIFGELSFGDPILIPYVFYAGFMAALFTRRQRPQPLLWLSLAWVSLFLLMYVYYGRLYPRFITVALPGVIGVYLSLLKVLWDHRHRYSYLLVAVASIILFSTVVNLARIGGYIVNKTNSYNEFARELEAIMDQDTTRNRKIMGHPAVSVAIRMQDAIPMHERYGIVSFEQRLREDMPRFWVTENLPRREALSAYFAHREWVERYFEIEFLGRWDVHNNYRFYQMAAFRLHPREEAIEEGFRRFGGTRPTP